MARTFTCVHAADVHLDTPYRRHDEATRVRLQDAGREAFVRLVDLAIEVQAHALLIAGDFFDNDWLTIATERLVVDELRRVTAAGVTVVYATGNHDPGRANYRAMQIDWPSERFHLIRSGTPETVPVERDGEVVGWVVGAGHQTPREEENLAAGFPSAPGPEPAVALLHTQVEGTASAALHDRYAPSTTADFGRKGYRYWALGHIHQPHRVHDDPLAWYAGNLQGRHFDETGAKGALLVSIPADGDPQVEFRPLAPVRWDVLALDDLGDVATGTEIAHRAAAAFRTLSGGDDVLPDQEWLLRVDLSGPCRLAPTLRDDDAQAELAEILRDDLGVLDVDLHVRDLHPPIEIEDHRGQEHLLGQTLSLLAAARTDDLALKAITPSDLAGIDRADTDRLRIYLRELLEGLDLVAAEALLREPAP